MMFKDNSGQALIEAIIALTIGALMISVATGVLSVILNSDEISQDNQTVSLLAGALADNLNVFAEKNWHNIYDLNKGADAKYFLATSTGQLAAQSGNENLNINGALFSRYFYIENVERDAGGNIGVGTNDPSTQKATIVAEWRVRSSTTTLSTLLYLTRHANQIFRQTDWFGGDGQDGPLAQINSRFASASYIDFSTTQGSIVPVTNIAINLYVADRDNDRIQKFDGNGNFILAWGSQGSGNGQFKKPQNVAIDSLNNIYVADHDNDRIQKFSSSGNFLLKWGSLGTGDGQFKHPIGIAVDTLDNIYAADLDNDRIQKFDSAGNFLLKWGSFGTTDGKFKKPQDVTTDSSNNVYAADGDNDRIQKFSSSGNFLLKWGSQGSDDGELKHPQDVTVDSLGNVYVADRDNDRIQKFDSAGNFLLKWGSQGIGDGQFKKPYSVTADNSDNIYVADSDNDRIQKFDGNGNFLLKWGSQGSDDGQFVHPQGLEYVPAGCVSNCELISSIFDTGVSGGAVLNTIMWQGSQPAGTAVKFQLASSNSSAGPWNYLGSDGTSSTYYVTAGPNVQAAIRAEDHNNKRYFRYKVILEISGLDLPRVDDVIISWSR